jgi:hypothetical protein
MRGHCYLFPETGTSSSPLLFLNDAIKVNAISLSLNVY